MSDYVAAHANQDQSHAAQIDHAEIVLQPLIATCSVMI